MTFATTKAQYDALHAAVESPRGKSTRVDKAALAALLRDYDNLLGALRAAGINPAEA